MIIKPSNRLNQVQTYYFATKLSQIEQMNQAGSEVINLGIGAPDLEPPMEVIEILKQHVEEPGMNSYQSYRGIPTLRESFAKWYHRHFDVSLSPDDELLPLIGSKEGIMHIAMSFLEKGDQALVPNPGYPTYKMASILAGADVLEYDLTASQHWLPDLSKLESIDLSKVKIMWLNYPHMPSGAIASKEVFAELINFAKRNNILLCHDNPYGFILNDHPTSIFEAEGAMEVALELSSLSKTFNMAGWRVGVLCGAAAYINTVLKFKSNMDSGMYKPIQLAATKALQLPEQWHLRLNDVYRNRREYAWKIMDFLRCEYDKHAAGMFVWAKAPHSIPDVEQWMERILIESRVFITPGFIFGKNGSRYIRISLCNDVNKFKRAFARIEQQVGLMKEEI